MGFKINDISYNLLISKNELLNYITDSNAISIQFSSKIPNINGTNRSQQQFLNNINYITIYDDMNYTLSNFSYTTTDITNWEGVTNIEYKDIISYLTTDRVFKYKININTNVFIHKLHILKLQNLHDIYSQSINNIEYTDIHTLYGTKYEFTDIDNILPYGNDISNTILDLDISNSLLVTTYKNYIINTMLFHLL